MARSAIPAFLHHLHRPLGRARIPPPHLYIRPYTYPKEGVFQPNSPPRQIPGFGPAPPLNPYDQHQPAQGLPPQQAQHFPQQPSQQIHFTPPPRGPRRFIPSWYKLLGSLLLTASGVYLVHAYLDIFFPLDPGTPEDAEELAALFDELDDFALIQQLRSETRLSPTQTQVPAWKEWTAYAGLDVLRKHLRFTTGPLAGTRGVAAQRCFWNEELQQLFLFVNFGPGVAGWPNVVHGGAISTVCDEALGRVAVRTTEEQTAVTATLEVKFLDKVEPGMWYVLVAGMDATRLEESKGRKKYVQGILMCASEVSPQKRGDTLVDAHPHAVANGLFVVPKNAGSLGLGPVPDDF